MTVMTKPTATTGPQTLKPDPVRTQLRGSSLLLAGRLLSRVINFASQLLIVRHLTTEDYGAFAYGLAVVAFCRGFSTLGLRRAVMRFLPIYHERGDYGRVLGTLVLVAAVVTVIGVLVIGAVYGAPELLQRLIKDDAAPVGLLLVLVFLVPIEAIDEMLIALFACFAHPKAIFYRKHVIAPVLKLGVVLMLVSFGAGAHFLAWGYLAAAGVGVALYVAILGRVLDRDGTLGQLRNVRREVPTRELFAFALPLLTSSLVAVVMHSADTMILGYFHPTTEVARYRVVLPAATLNTIVLASFGLLYMPLAARMFARDDIPGINVLYWRTAVWMAVLSFPVFAVTFSLARSITVALYGERYAGSWIILQLFAIAYYFGVSLGNNGLTLKVLGKVRYVVVVNVAAMLASVTLAGLLIPRFGALGAAIATATAMILHNVLKQVGLCRATGMRFIEWRYAPVYAVLLCGAIGLLFVQLFVSTSLYVLLPLACLVSLSVLALTRERLAVEETFPELLRVPGLSRLLRSKDPRPAQERRVP
jgi:O-antigen/teichoic acid export membrane protein